jgi:hypothetical protein
MIGQLHDGRVIIDVGLQSTSASIAAVSPIHTGVEIPIRKLKGLLDTGAQTTCIVPSVIKEVGLRSRGRVRLGNVSSIEYHRSFSLILGLWYNYADPLGKVKEVGYYSFQPILGCEFRQVVDFDVLIGMDLIRQGDLTIRKSGEFVWTLP